MLLQKTGLRIKQLISHRSNSSSEECGISLEDQYFSGSRLSTSVPKRLSWLSQSPSEASPRLRRTSSTATAKSIILTPANTTAHSSASSLCSCDCEAKSAVECSLSKGIPPPTQPEVLYLSPPPSATTGDAKTWQLIFSEPSPPSTLLVPRPSSKPKHDVETSPYSTIGKRSTADLFEAVSLIDGDKTPTQSVKNMNDLNIERMDDNVEKLIRETDEAFQAVGSALANVRDATSCWYEDMEGAVSKTGVEISSGRSSSSRGNLRKTFRPPSRSISVKAYPGKGNHKRKKSTKKKKATFLSRALLRKTTPAPAVPINSPRWTLTDVTTNMAEVFSGKMWRVEADEMLTPGRIEQIKQHNLVESGRKSSIESARSNTGTDCSTPTEPFHLESLSSRIDAQIHINNGPPSSPSPILPPPAIPPKSKRRGCDKNTIATEDPKSTHSVTSLHIDDINISIPPSNSPPASAQSRAPRRPSATRAAAMPTILEASPFIMTIRKCRSFDLKKHCPPEISAPQSYTTLPSTPFTLTSPFFRHGPIRIERVDRGRKESFHEENMDWTAFQIAIQGTVNEYDMKDSENSMEEEELNDIIDWWEEFGFQGYGELTSVEEGERMKQEMAGNIQAYSPRDRSRKSASREVAYPKTMPVSSPTIKERRGRQIKTWPRDQVQTEAQVRAHKRFSFEPETPLASPQQPPSLLQFPRRKSSLSIATDTSSLPPSPMLDLTPLGNGKGYGVGKGGEEFIPMGFNLGHDLGDFLSWEAYHVQNFGFSDGGG